jgi:hypothetical protein
LLLAGAPCPPEAAKSVCDAAVLRDRIVVASIFGVSGGDAPPIPEEGQTTDYQ